LLTTNVILAHRTVPVWTSSFYM